MDSDVPWVDTERVASDPRRCCCSCRCCRGDSNCCSHSYSPKNPTEKGMVGTFLDNELVSEKIWLVLSRRGSRRGGWISRKIRWVKPSPPQTRFVSSTLAKT
eukprot:scaffold1959_cov162-Amphora_coffeaeformis.AAC.8